MGRPTAASRSFGYEDYDERRVFANKVDSVFTEFRKKWKIGGRLIMELSRNVEWCKAGRQSIFLAVSTRVCTS